MIRTLKQFVVYIANSYISIASIALLIGVLYAQTLEQWLFITTPLLQVIFFLSSLKMDVTHVVQEMKKIKTIGLVTLSMLLILPVIVYPIARIIVPDMAFALLLLSAMPAGMTTPLLVEVIKGDVELGLVLTVATSLLAPFTIPFVIYMLAGQTVSMNPIDMFTKLFMIIVVPFVLAMIVRYVQQERIVRYAPRFKPVSLLLLGALIALLVAPQAEAIVAQPEQMVRYFLVMILFYIMLHAIGYALGWKRPHTQRLSIMVSMTYMNFTLALYLAGRYFPQPEVVLPLVIQIIPWALMILPATMMIEKIRNNTPSV